ncbi:MAG: diguanylate cyclase [Coriobacteriia bacterium]|nr:diguanylate cyclase [Coriobacteriia bacterium]
MRGILELCVKMDRLADDLYQTLARDCPEPELAALFARLAEDEAEHTGWWEGLLTAWDRGLLPDLVNDTSGLVERLAGLYEEFETIELSALGTLSAEQMLALAARVEFFMIDPVFGELIELTEPGQAEKRHTVYQAHVQRLVNEIAQRYPADSLAGLLATSLARAWTDNMRLATFATHDSLTGLYNRRALRTHLPQWAAWSARYGHPLTVLLVDIDFFKDVNDRFGHATGDRALREIATAMDAGVRASDLVIRYGGDEFAVIAPETGIAEYDELCARVLDAARAVCVDTDSGETLRFTVSIGGAVTHDAAGSPPRRLEAMLAAADQSLYAAKQTGRDRAGTPIALSAS